MQSVTCLSADMCLTADPRVASSIPGQSHTFVRIDHKIISTAILPSTDSRRVVVSYKRKYVHKVLVNRLVKLAKEKEWCPDMTTAVDWDVKHQTKENKPSILLEKKSKEEGKDQESIQSSTTPDPGHHTGK